MAYAKGGARDTGGTRRKSGGKVGEEGEEEEENVEERGRRRKMEQSPAEIKRKGRWRSAGVSCEPSPRFSYDPPITKGLKADRETDRQTESGEGEQGRQGQR